MSIVFAAGQHGQAMRASLLAIATTTLLLGTLWASRNFCSNTTAQVNPITAAVVSMERLKLSGSGPYWASTPGPAATTK